MEKGTNAVMLAAALINLVFCVTVDLLYPLDDAFIGQMNDSQVFSLRR